MFSISVFNTNRNASIQKQSQTLFALVYSIVLVATKFGIFWKPYKLELFGNDVYCIPLQSVFFLLYNDTLLVTIVSSRAEILPL